MSKYILPLSLYKGYKTSLLSLLSIVSIITGINTIISKNPVLSVLYLIALFATVALYFITLGLDFIGLSYLLIYIGAISILFIIILMLINIRISELLQENRNNLFLAILTLFCFNYLTSEELPYSNYVYNTLDLDLNNSVEFYKYSDLLKDLNLSFPVNQEKITTVNCNSPAWDTGLVTSFHVITIGNILYTVFSPLFIVLALILLLAMIGAILVTTNKSSKKIFDISLSDNK